MNKNLNLLLLMSVLIGALIVVLFFNTGAGILLTSIILLLLIVFIIESKKLNKFKLKRGYILLISIILLSITYSIFPSSIFSILNIFIILWLSFIYTNYMIDSKPFKLSFNWILIILESTYFPIGDFHIAIKVLSKNLKSLDIKTFTTKTKGIIFGFILAIPLLAIMIYLLSSADLIFKSIFNFNFLSKFNLPTFIGKLIILSLSSLYIFSYFYRLLYKEKNELNKKNDPFKKKQSEISNDKKNELIQLKDAIAKTILVLLNILFLIFTFIQLKYLFNSNFIIDTNFTYSAYARKGFFELTLISMINLFIITLFYSYIKGVFSKLLMSILILNTVVIALSAIFRMNLYIEEYGYTFLRIISLAFIYLQGILLFISLFHLFYNKFDIKILIALIYLFSYIMFNFINIDSLIIKGNMNRYLDGYNLDTEYFSSLSLNSVETLLYYKDIFKSNKKHSKINYELLTVLRSKKQNIKDEAWYNFNYTNYKSKKLLSDI